MSGAADVARLHRKLDKIARELDGSQLEAKLLKVGKEASKFVDDAVRSTPAKKGSLSDGVMSGAGRWSTFSLKGEAKATKHDGRNAVVIRPAGRSRGPMRVLEDGRRAAGVGQLRYKGKAKATKNRGEASRLKVVRRTVGATESKKTWTHAVTVMERYAPVAGRRVFVESWKKALS